jgi:drug/metabolite transporter (DMT)-like permease
LELSLDVTFAVLFAALLHASWNALLKSGRDPLLDTGLIALAGSVLGLALALVVPPPPPASWPFILASALIHIGYYAALVGAYRAGDLSHGYPIMRGAAPLLTALASGLWLFEPLSAGAWVGVMLICGGVLSLSLVGGRASVRATRWALFNAVIICLYTLADGAGVRASGDALRYVVWLFVVQGLPFGFAVIAWKRGAFFAHAAVHWQRAALGALMSGLSYGIALWAMTRAPVAIVAALRETSVIFAALIGAWLLKEGAIGPRLAGAAAVLAGLVALRL